ncbi:toxin-antitoxin system HicB family antitoxin [Nostoc sp. GT001]
MVRMSKSLHCRLAETPEREGVSLNQNIVCLLSAVV